MCGRRTGLILKDLEKVVLDLDLDCVVHSHILYSN